MQRVEFDSRSAWQGKKKEVTQHGACCTPHKESLKTTTWWPSGLFCVLRSQAASQLLSCRAQMKAIFTHLSECPYHGSLNQSYIIWVKVLPAAVWGPSECHIWTVDCGVSTSVAISASLGEFQARESSISKICYSCVASTTVITIFQLEYFY